MSRRMRLDTAGNDEVCARGSSGYRFHLSIIFAIGFEMCGKAL